MFDQRIRAEEFLAGQHEADMLELSYLDVAPGTGWGSVPVDGPYRVFRDDVASLWAAHLPLVQHLDHCDVMFDLGGSDRAAFDLKLGPVVTELSRLTAYHVVDINGPSARSLSAYVATRFGHLATFALESDFFRAPLKLTGDYPVVVLVGNTGMNLARPLDGSRTRATPPIVAWMTDLLERHPNASILLTVDTNQKGRKLEAAYRHTNMGTPFLRALSAVLGDRHGYDVTAFEPAVRWNERSAQVEFMIVARRDLQVETARGSIRIAAGKGLIFGVSLKRSIGEFTISLAQAGLTPAVVCRASRSDMAVYLIRGPGYRRP